MHDSHLPLAAEVSFTQLLIVKYALQTIYEHIPACGLLALLGVLGVVELVLVLALCVRWVVELELVLALSDPP